MAAKESHNVSVDEISEDNYKSRIGRLNVERYKEDKPKVDLDDSTDILQSAEKDKIISQNIKLKEQIFELSQQLEEILQKDRNRKRKLGPISPNDDDETLREKKAELKKQQLQILEMKNKIYAVKRQLEKVYNNRTMIAKEDKLRALKHQLKQLDQEKEGLMRIKHQHRKNIKSMTTEQQYQERADDLKKELVKVKEEARVINEKVAEAEKILRKNHEQYIAKQQKLRQLEQRLAISKERLKSKKPLQTITPEMIASLQEQIGILQQERRQNERLWQEKIRSIDLQFQQKKLQEEKKLMVLKEKEKQYRLNELKIKELRKLVRFNMGSQSKRGQEIDMSQFRHKRNIKHLDK